MQLCAYCTGCLDGTADLFGKQTPGCTTFRHHISVGSFAEAVREYCALCCRMWCEICQSFPSFSREASGMICNQVPEDELSNTEPKGEAPPVISAYIDAVTFVLHWDGPVRLAEYKSVSWDITPSSKVLRGYTKGLAAPTYLPSTSQTAVSRAEQLARFWVAQCLDHAKCNAFSASTEYMPRRLIKIGKRSRFRLVSSTSGQQTLQYATLSYCWGKVDVLTLTKARIAEFEHGMDLGVLPLAFQEAFTVCHALDIQYIWIDSLCIIQDDPDDWKREAAEMADIYRNAFVSISADASDNSQGGLFRESTILNQHPIRRRILGSKLLDDTVEYDFIDNFEIQKRLGPQPLNSRGWVCQERVLARRILHFTDTGPLWECHTHYATEAYEQGIPEELCNPYGLRNLDTSFSLAAFCGYKTSLHVFLEQWYTVVWLFTDANLTFPDDRPFAILGLATEMSRLSGMRYILGMWEDSLITQLLWRDDTMAADRPQEPICFGTLSKRKFPSFSWLSLNGPIRMFRGRGAYEPSSTLCTIVDTQIGEIENGATGLVQQATIQSKGVLRPITLIVEWDGKKKRNTWTFEGFESDDWSIHPDWSRPGIPTTNFSRYECYVLMMTALESRYDTHRYGLLLQKTNAKQSQFSRIARCDHLIPKSPEDYPANLQRRHERLEQWVHASSEERAFELV